MIVSMGYTEKLFKKIEKKNFHKNSFPQKTSPKIVSLLVHRNGYEKRNSKLRNLFSLKYHFHKNLSQRSYQWGTHER